MGSVRRKDLPLVNKGMMALRTYYRHVDGVLPGGDLELIAQQISDSGRIRAFYHTLMDSTSGLDQSGGFEIGYDGSLIGSTDTVEPLNGDAAYHFVFDDNPFKRQDYDPLDLYGRVSHTKYNKGTNVLSFDVFSSGRLYEMRKKYPTLK